MEEYILEWRKLKMHQGPGKATIEIRQLLLFEHYKMNSVEIK